MKYLTLLATFSLLGCMIRTSSQNYIQHCVRCTPCGEQQRLERLPMKSVPSLEGGDQWSYIEGRTQWTSVLFAETPRKNYIESERNN